MADVILFPVAWAVLWRLMLTAAFGRRNRALLCTSAYMKPGSMEGRAALSPNWALVATGGDAVRLRLANGALLRTLEPNAWLARAVAFSPDGSLLAAGLSDGTVRFWEVQP